MNNHEIIYLFKYYNSNSALRVLYEEWIPKVISVVKNLIKKDYPSIPFEINDFKSTIYTTAVESLWTYKLNDKGSASVENWIIINCINACRNQIRKILTKQGSFENYLMSFDALPSFVTDSLSVVNEQEAVEECDFDKLRSKLDQYPVSDLEKNVLELRALGMKNHQIARALNIKAKKVSNTYQALRLKLSLKV